MIMTYQTLHELLDASLHLTMANTSYLQDHNNLLKNLLEETVFQDMPIVNNRMPYLIM